VPRRISDRLLAGLGVGARPAVDAQKFLETPLERHFRIRVTLLSLLLMGGTMGAPLIGPLREHLQAVLGVSRAELGLGVFAAGLLAGTVNLLATLGLKGRVPRTTFVRIGTVLTLGGMTMLALVEPRPGRGVVLIGLGWFMVMLGSILFAVAGAIVMDIWHHAPQRGVILLHGTNAIGKVLAPLLVIALGQGLNSNAAIYSVVLAVLVVDMWTWPRASVRDLVRTERGQIASRDHPSALWRRGLFWVAAAQFAFISGSEAGVVSILGSFAERLRPSPIAALDASRWAAAVLVIMQLGILAGRFFFFFLSCRLREQTIVLSCVLCAVFAIPGVLATAPAVYLPCLFMLGVTFSATYPAYFTIAAKTFIADRTVFSVAAAWFARMGISACILLSSVIGNQDRFLSLAVVVSTALIAFPACWLFFSGMGAQLRAAAQTSGSGVAEQTSSPTSMEV